MKIPDRMIGTYSRFGFGHGIGFGEKQCSFNLSSFYVGMKTCEEKLHVSRF